MLDFRCYCTIRICAGIMYVRMYVRTCVRMYFEISESHTMPYAHDTSYSTVAIPDSDSYSITLTTEMNEILQV